MTALDRFWGLPDGPPMRVGAAPASGGAPIRFKLDDGPLDLAPFGGEPIALPPPSAILGGDPLITANHGTSVLAVRDPQGEVAWAFDPEVAVRRLTSFRALSTGPPASARLPIPYHRVPAPARRVVRDLMTRRQSSGGAGAGIGLPAWPVEPSVEAIRLMWLRARQALDPTLEPQPFWPGGKRFALVLTHDLDTADGVRRAVALAEEEAERGLTSCSYVVGGDFALDEGAMAALAAHGELGLHDVAHDNRLAFLPPEQIATRLDGARALMERWDMTGFRSPSLLRTDALYDAVGERFAYDSSMPDTSLLPSRNGCATVFPLRHRGVGVLPLTLPPDGQLRGRQGLDPDAIVAEWVAKAEWIRAVGGVAVHLTHPEVGFTDTPPMRAAYRRFLDWAAAQDDAWHALPRDVMTHWTARDRALEGLRGG